MKLLLTSGGLMNDSMKESLRALLSKEFKDSKLAFIPTAANMEAGDKGWLIKDLVICQELGFKEVDLVDIAAVSKDVWQPRLEAADVIVVGGGNTSYLMKQVKESGLAEALPKLLETRVYVGISAGSMIVAPKLREKEMQRLYEEPVVDDSSNEGLGFVDFLVVPHVDSPYFPRVSELVDEVAKNVEEPLYALDDASAVQVVDGKEEVITEGKWKKYGSV